MSWESWGIDVRRREVKKPLSKGSLFWRDIVGRRGIVCEGGGGQGNLYSDTEKKNEEQLDHHNATETAANTQLIVGKHVEAEKAGLQKLTYIASAILLFMEYTSDFDPRGGSESGRGCVIDLLRGGG